jgi:hypothetical protein
MPLAKLAQHSWNTYSYSESIEVEYAWDSEYETTVALPSGFDLVVAMAGGITELDARVPIQNPYLMYESLNGDVVYAASSGPDTDGACGNVILYRQYSSGDGYMRLQYGRSPKIHGAGVRLAMAGVDQVAADPVFASADSSGMTGTSGSISIPNCLPAYSLLSICTIRGSQAITPGAGQVVLLDQLADDSSCRVMVTHSYGLATLAASFSWVGSAAWTIAGAVFKTNVGSGNQIAVIG